MLPTTIRGILENVRKAVTHESAPHRYAGDTFSLFALPIKSWKAYKQPRNVDELDFIVTHITDVRGGFGVSRRAVSRWLGKLRGAKHNEVNSTGYPSIDGQLVWAGVWEPVLLQPTGAPYRFGADPEASLQALARRLALWERYRAGVPYHQIGAANGDNLANRELSHVTWHGTLGNFGAGWALDVGHADALTSDIIETGRESLRALYKRIMSASAKAQRDGVRLAPHRAFDPNRRGDPGARVHREVVLPVVRQLDGLDVDYHISRGKGRPVPLSWDDNALYGDNGRPLK